MGIRIVIRIDEKGNLGVSPRVVLKIPIILIILLFLKNKKIIEYWYI